MHRRGLTLSTSVCRDPTQHLRRSHPTGVLLERRTTDTGAEDENFCQKKVENLEPEHDKAKHSVNSGFVISAVDFVTVLKKKDSPVLSTTSRVV